MMTDGFVLWRCLHDGPLTNETVNHLPEPCAFWETLWARNIPLLTKLHQVYGACAVLVRDGSRVVGMLRFYPKTVCQMTAMWSGMCMQQAFAAGPADDFADSAFPPLTQITDKTLFVHCMMTGSPGQKDNPYQRRGLGSGMVRTLIEWARERGWTAIEANAGADLPCIYAITGKTGRMFWEKLGFHVVATIMNPAFREDTNGFVSRLLKEAAERNMDASEAKSKYTMRLDLA